MHNRIKLDLLLIDMSTCLSDFNQFELAFDSFFKNKNVTGFKESITYFKTTLNNIVTQTKARKINTALITELENCIQVLKALDIIFNPARDNHLICKKTLTSLSNRLKDCFTRIEIGNNIFTALKVGTVDHLRALLENNANPNAVETEENEFINKTPLYCAIKMKDSAKAQLLFVFGAKIYHGSRPLLLDAMESGDMKMFDLLFSFGANPNKSDTDKVSPLHKAILMGNPDIANALISYGVDINEYINGHPLVCFAEMNQQFMIAKYLLKAKFNQYFEKTQLRAPDDKKTHVNFTLFGRKFDLGGVGFTAGEKCQRAQNYGLALFATHQSSIKQVVREQLKSEELLELCHEADGYLV